MAHATVHTQMNRKLIKFINCRYSTTYTLPPTRRVEAGKEEAPLYRLLHLKQLQISTTVNHTASINLQTMFLESRYVNKKSKFKKNTFQEFEQLSLKKPYLVDTYVHVEVGGTDLLNYLVV